MGRLLLKIGAGLAAVLVFFWLLSIVVGVLVWGLMIALVVGVVWLGIRMLKTDAGGSAR
ncbi:hypothetical protein KIK06_06365 [Nocardiopsis sp. EMB25]|uniref:hypothetical protein n=1 Tax=Nocardiopsis TaxID=2013 RepID=UPI00034DC628|nr:MULTISPECIES: hypothetical protein [Nocardiopsis]MCY9783517.1 hypothetical protein [Nocardiopsis sp. EMB25]